MSDERFDRLDDKLDKVVDRLGSIDITLAKQEVSLGEHIRRTLLLENRLEPIEKHDNYVQGGLKLIGFTSVILGIIKSVLFFVR